MTGAGECPSASAFDAHHAPSPELISQCVHCGFCLPACPTYVLWGNEMDSPRGRIYLMKMAGTGQTEITPDWVEHFDTCLGCMSCLTACPSGVQYDALIESTRGQIERLHKRPLADRLFRKMMFSIFPRIGRLRILRRSARAIRNWESRPWSGNREFSNCSPRGCRQWNRSFPGWANTNPSPG